MKQLIYRVVAFSISMLPTFAQEMIRHTDENNREKYAPVYHTDGEWIRENFKELFFILNNGAFRGMYREGDTSLASYEWVEKHILSNPSPLAQLYPNYRGGDPWGNVGG